MAKAYVYDKQINGRKVVAATFLNGTDLVSIYHDRSGIYHQHVMQGEVDYSSPPSDIAQHLSEYDHVITDHDVGQMTRCVWRPGLTVDVRKALEIEQAEEDRAKKDLKILIEKLHELLLVIEPDDSGLKSHGHKIRELLLLACTELESYWLHYLRLAGYRVDRYTTSDYVRLCDKLHLREYQVTFSSHPYEIPLSPFANWSETKPSESLDWYDAYNKTKHDKRSHFNEATLRRALNAVAAIIVLFCVRYSPYEIKGRRDLCSALVDEYFDVEVVDPDYSSFYVPMVEKVRMSRGALKSPLGTRFKQWWKIEPFTL